MSKRPVDGDFWEGGYVAELAPLEKLVYIYLITNPRSNIAGLLEYQPKLFAFNTGLSIEEVQTIIQKLAVDGKLCVFDDYVALVKWGKHQTASPAVNEGICRILGGLSSDRLQTLRDGGYTLPPNMRWETIINGCESHKKEIKGDGGGTVTGRLGGGIVPHSTLLRLNSTSPNGSPPKTQGDDLKKSLDSEKGAGKQPFVLTHAERATVGEKWPSVDVEAAYRFVAESAPTVWNSPAYFVKRLETMKADGSLPAKRANYNGFKLNT